MAPAIAKFDRVNKVEAILALARNLEVTLQETSRPQSLNAQLCKEIEKFTFLQDVPVSNKKIELDKQGTRLWNLASKLKHEKPDDAELLCSVRVLAYLIVDFVGRQTLNSTKNEIRILRTALKATKYCLEEKQLALAETVIERAAFYDERLRERPDTQKSLSKSLSSQYLIVRIGLAWQQDRLDLAKLMLTKLIATSDDIDPPSTEELSDLLHEIGKHLMAKSEWIDASFWLEAAYNRISIPNLGILSHDAEGLKTAIMHLMVKSFAHQQGQDGLKKAWDILQELSIQRRDDLNVLLLRLDLLAVDPTPSVNDYKDTLWKFASSVHLTDASFGTILHHIHNLRAKEATMAHTVLSLLLGDRLLGGKNKAWLEKTLVTIVWNCTTSKDFPDVIANLRTALDMANDSDDAISSSATHAGQVLLWRRVEAAYNEKCYELAESWCRLSLHDVFKGCGNLNTGKLQRKLILCSLGMSDGTKAREVVSSMSEANKSNASTQYLLYKVALCCQDSEMAARSLNAICSSTQDGTLLYACVLEAQRVGDESQIITALQRVLEQFNHTAPTGVHLPALLRCNARILMRSTENLTSETIESLCKVFEGAAIQAKHSLRKKDSDSLFTITELDWFSRNCYNLSLQVCHTWPPRQTLRIVRAALEFIGIYPSNLDPTILADLSLRRLFCDFMLCSMSIHLARRDDNVDSQLQHYLSARQSVSDWRSHRPNQDLRLESGALSDLTVKQITLLAYDFEAAARLKSWHDFYKILVECQDCNDMTVFAILADIVLASEAPSDIIVDSLQQIINATWQIKTIDIEKLSRWIRCLISQALSSDGNITEKIVDQAVTIVQNANKTNEMGRLYPAEELEWLATTIFNRAIDFYCSSLDVECRRWAEKALTLGSLCKDGGLMHGQLQQNFQKLVWQDRQ